MMKNMLAVTFAAVLAAAGLSAEEGHKHESGAKAEAAAATTVTGEVVDLACFMAHDGAGKKHKKCAETCLLGGQPAGLLTKDGTVYLLLEDHSDKDAVAQHKSLKKLAAEQVKVTGTLTKKGGLQAIVVSKVEKV